MATFFEDDFEPDAMDEARRRDIEKLKHQPAFSPHCPECWNRVFEGYNTQAGWYWCNGCQQQFTTNHHIYLRTLAPTPAPPLTNEEIAAIYSSYPSAPTRIIPA